MRRRTFLRASGSALAALAIPAQTERARAADTIDLLLTSRPVAGTRGERLAFNGAIPGPLLRVTKGQRVRIRYVSRVPIPTSIHWHGMIVPNAMDGVAGVTQPAVEPGGEYLYEFSPSPAGTRWYHDHAFAMGLPRGLFGMFVVDEPDGVIADREFALVLHDVPVWSSIEAALRGRSVAPMSEPALPPAAMRMESQPMGDEVAYSAYCINGHAYPHSGSLAVRTGERVRLRILNASPTQTHYLQLAGHELAVTHADGAALERSVAVDVLRIGSGERYDVVVDVRTPGAFLLQSISSDPRIAGQAVVLHTEGSAQAAPERPPATLEGARVSSYQLAGGLATAPRTERGIVPTFELSLGGGGWGDGRWMIDGKVWPETPKLEVRRGDVVTLRFRNTSDMDHPMHLHGHIFELLESAGAYLARPLVKDVALVPARGTMTWRFRAGSERGRWLLHCHNEIHMAGGMMTELIYRTA